MKGPLKESRPQEFHPQPLAERCVSLSTHTAPIKQTQRRHPVSLGCRNGLSALIRLLPFPVGRRMQPLDPAPLLQPHYRPSSLLRAGPPQSLSSVLSPHGFRHLCFSLGIQALVPVVPHKSLDRVHAPYTPAAARPVAKYPAHSSQRSRPPLVPAALILFDASSKGLLALVSPDRTCPQIASANFDPNAHHHSF